MQPILPILNLGEPGLKVVNVRKALVLLAQRGVIKAGQDAEHGTAQELKRLVERARNEWSFASLGEATSQLLVYFQIQQGLPHDVHGTVEDTTADRLNSALVLLGVLPGSGVVPSPAEPELFVVEGCVCLPARGDTSGAPVAGVTVQAFDEDIDGSWPLGQAVTDPDGKYHITFSEAQFEAGDVGGAVADLLAPMTGAAQYVSGIAVVRAGPDLWVGVPDDDNGFKTKSEVVYNADRRVSIDLVLPEQAAPIPSEMESLVCLVAPRLKGLRLDSLTARHVDFLTRETGATREQISALVAAARILAAIEAACETRQALPTDLPIAFIYALLRDGLPSSLPELATVPLLEIERAVLASLERQVVSDDLRPLLPDLLDRWDRARAAHAALQPDPATRMSTADLLDAVAEGLDPVLRSEVERLAARAGSLNESVIDELMQLPGFSEHAAVRQLRHAASFAGVVDGDARLLTALTGFAKYRHNVARASDLVRLDLDDWKAVVAAGMPHGSSDSSVAVITGKAIELRRRIDRTYPGEGAHVRIESNEWRLSDAAKRRYDVLVERHPDFRLGAREGTAALAETIPVEGDGADGESPVYELLALNTLLETAGSALDVGAVLGAGYRSVGDVYEAGRPQFVKALTRSDGDDAPAWEVEKAETAYARYAAARDVGTFGATPGIIESQRPRIHGIDGPAAQAQSTLFALAGNAGTCGCAGCRSVISQSAYLTDLLSFLRDATPTNGVTPLMVLLQRRPDVQEVLLDCANEKTAIPYVDLVNEILERAVIRRTDPQWLRVGAPGSRATLVAALDAGAVPQEIIDDLTTAAVRVSSTATVETLNAGRRWRIRDARWVVDLINLASPVPTPGTSAFRALPWPQSSSLDDASRPSPPLQLMAAYELLDRALYPWSLPFDLPAHAVSEVLSARGVRSDDLVRVFAAGFAPQRAAAASLHRLGLADLDLQALAPGNVLSELEIAQRWGFDSTTLSVPDPSPQYDSPLNRPAISGWTNIAARVVFLLERSGLSFVELQRLFETAFVNPSGTFTITSVDPSDPQTCDVRKLRLAGLTEPETFLAIYDFVRLSRRTGLDFASLDVLLATVGQPSRKETLERLAEAIPLAARTGLPPRRLSVFWSSVSTRVYGRPGSEPGMGGSSTYAEVFRSDPRLAALLPENPAALSWPTFAVAGEALSAALGIARADYLRWLAASGLQPNARVSVRGLSSLLRNVLLARSVDATIDDYALGRSVIASDPFGLSDRSPFATTRFLNQWAEIRGSGTSVETLAYTLNHKGPLVAGREAAAVAAAEALRRDLSTVWEEPEPIRKEALARSLSAFLGIDAAQAIELLDRLRVPAGSTRSMAQFFTDRESWPADTTPPAPPTPISRTSANDVVSALVLADKAVRTLTGLRLSREHWPWILQDAAPRGWLDLNQLPADAPSDDSVFDSWEQLARWASWIRRSGAPTERIQEYVSYLAGPGSTRDGAHEILANLVPIERDDLNVLLGRGTDPGLWEANFPAAYWTADLLLRLDEAAALAGKIRVPPGDLVEWFDGSVRTFADRLALAETVKSAVGGALDAEVWTRVRTEYEKRSRAARRRALVDYLVAVEQVPSANGLFDRYLIDVDMSPEMRSTRTAQAIFATQLFVHRALLRLEPGVTLRSNDAEEWSRWRKWYRVWEANRKIFLFPENWLYPEFRDDKSPIFRELESDLAQSDLTSGKGIEAFDSYLNRFQQVTRLQAVSLLNTTDERGRLVTHIVARTHQGPATYYYRQRTKGVAWTAWEKIEADITGDFVIPIVHGRRVQLLWATIEEPPPAGQESGAQAVPPEWQVQFARTRRTDGGWKPKEAVGSSFGHPQLRGKTATESFVFRSLEDPSGDVRLLAFGAIEQARTLLPAPRATLDDWQLEPTDPVWVTIHVYASDRPEVGIGGVSVTIRRQDGSGTFTSPPTTAEGNASFFLSDAGERRIYDIELSDSNQPPVLWYWNGADLNLGNYSEGLQLEVNGTEYRSIYVPIQALNRAAPAAPVDPSRPVAWQQIAEMIASPSGQVRTRTAIGDIALQPPAAMVHRGMGYAPAGPPFDVSLSSSQVAQPVIRSSTRGVDLIGSARGTGMRLGITAFVIGTHPDLGFESPFVLSAPEGAYLGESQSLVQYSFGTGITLPVAGSVTLLALHYRRDSALLNAWSRGDPKVLGQTLIQAPGGDTDKTLAISKAPQTTVDVALPPEGIEFDHDRPNSIYNWEIFLHIPWTIGTRLAENRRFAEAQQWFHLIFDPTGGSGAGGPGGHIDAWKCRPIREALSDRATIVDILSDRSRLTREVALWEDHPFHPHVLARLRPHVYATAVLKAYINNLIEWGDHVARRNTLEAVNEATQLYVFASNLLGPRPPARVGRRTARSETFSRLADFDPLSNPAAPLQAGAGAGGATPSGAPSIDLRYFCIPDNDDLLELWARVENRFLRVRSGIGISLFGPPIDPALLVQAAALGMDTEQFMNALSEPALPYRYQALVQKALEFCAEVKAMGAALLAAMEKRDVEELSLIRARHDKVLATLQRDVRNRQREEAESALVALHTQRGASVERLIHFRKQLNQSGLPAPVEGQLVSRIAPVVTAATESHFDVDTRQLGLSSREVQHLNWLTVANNYSIAASILSGVAGFAHFAPNFSWGSSYPIYGASVSTSTSYGGSNVGQGVASFATLLQALATNANFQATASGLVGGHERRRDEWAYQHNVVAAETEQIDRQILTARARIAVAAAEERLQQEVIANSEEMDEFLRAKFSSKQLYHWMVRQLSGAYFRAYQMAWELGKASETAFRREVPSESAALLVKPAGYWDTLKEGLLAGELLSLDVRRIEAEYLRNNRRELEITKHISLRRLDPAQLLTLRATGSCEFETPEWLFDLDCAGHYARRLKTVSLSIPCVTGPYTGVHCKVSLLRSEVRTKPTSSGLYPRRRTEDDDRFVDQFREVESIVTSGGSNDGGLFEVNLRDERYLPFEGAGAIARWKLELPPRSSDDGGFTQFDYDTISDAILHVRYTARDGGAGLKGSAEQALRLSFGEAQADVEMRRVPHLLSAKHDFPAEWILARELAPRRLSVRVTRDHLPYWASGFNLDSAQWLAPDASVLGQGSSPASIPGQFEVNLPAEADDALLLLSLKR